MAGEVAAPTRCPTCEGTGVILVPLNGEFDEVVRCPACCCQSCGKPNVAGGICDGCEVADFMDDDYRHKVNEGSRP